MSGTVWPDGGALLDQPARLIQAFDIIGSALEQYREKK
jgi:hypothetical protein